MTITWLNEIDLPNQIAMFAVSNNAQHVFVVTNLEHWQIDSQNRTFMKYGTNDRLLTRCF